MDLAGLDVAALAGQLPLAELIILWGLKKIPELVKELKDGDRAELNELTQAVKESRDFHERVASHLRSENARLDNMLEQLSQHLLKANGRSKSPSNPPPAEQPSQTYEDVEGKEHDLPF